jgi:DNA modification methylase
MELNKIITWDCIDILRGSEVLDSSIDLLCIDPPYEFISKNPRGWGFMRKENKKHLEELNDSFWMSYNPSEFLKLIGRKMKKFNAYIRTNKTLVPKYIEFAESNWYKWEILLWLKSNPVPVNRGHYLIDKEYCIYIKEQWATFNSDLGYKNYFTYEIHPIGNRKYNHPTVKPLEFIERIIKVSTNEWDTVLDCYLWSGTTAVACKKLNRNFIGIEINPEYVEISEQRLREVDKLKQQTLFAL